MMHQCVMVKSNVLIINEVELSLDQIINDKHIHVFCLDNKKHNICRLRFSPNILYHTLFIMLLHWDIQTAAQNNYFRKNYISRIISAKMQSLITENNPWILEAFAKYTDCTSKVDMRKYSKNLSKESTEGNLFEILIFCIIFECEITISFQDENDSYSTINTEDVFNTFVARPIFDVRKSENIGYSSKLIDYHKSTTVWTNKKWKNYFYFQPNDNYMKYIQHKNKKKILDKVNKFAIGQFVLLNRKHIADLRVLNKSTKRKCLKELNKAYQINDESLKKTTTDGKKHKSHVSTNTTSLDKSASSSTFESKSDLSDLCVIATKGLYGVEYLMLNMRQISLFDTIYKKQIDHLTIGNKKYHILDVPSDNSCCFHALSLVISHWQDLQPIEYMHGPALRQKIATTLFRLLHHKTPWILNAFDVLTDCTSSQERFTYISELRDPNTWGQRLEILIFCYLYKCELFIANTAEDNTFKFDSTTDLINDILKDKPIFDIKRTSYIASVHARDFSLADNKPKNHYIFLKAKNTKIFHTYIAGRNKLRKLHALSKHTFGTAKDLFNVAIEERRKIVKTAKNIQNSKFKVNKTGKIRNEIKEEYAIQNVCPPSLTVHDYINIKKIWQDLDGKLH